MYILWKIHYNVDILLRSYIVLLIIVFILQFSFRLPLTSSFFIFSIIEFMSTWRHILSRHGLLFISRNTPNAGKNAGNAHTEAKKCVGRNAKRKQMPHQRRPISLFCRLEPIVLSRRILESMACLVQFPCSLLILL